MGQLGPSASGTAGMDDGSSVKRTVEPFTSPRVQTSPAERAKSAALRLPVSEGAPEVSSMVVARSRPRWAVWRQNCARSSTARRIDFDSALYPASVSAVRNSSKVMSPMHSASPSRSLQGSFCDSNT